MSDEDKGFEVKDKRKLNLDDDAPAEEKAPEAAPAEEKSEAGGAGDHIPGPEKGHGPEDPGDMPPLDFIAFIGSLGASALMHLGEQIAPGQPVMDVNLPAARQMIDLLDMLKLKTSGNLDSNEQASLDNLLYNLRIRYSHKVSGK